MKETPKLTSNIDQVARVLFPAAFGESIGEIASILVLFPDKSKRHFIRLSFMTIFVFVYMVDGLLFPFIDTHFLPMPRESLGPLQYSVHFLYGMAMLEIVLTRAYVFLVHFKGYKDKLHWFRLSKGINKQEFPQLFLATKAFFIILYSSVTILFIAQELAKLYLERCLLIDVLVNCFWIVTNVFFIRFAVNDMPFLYVIAGSCYFRVRKDCSSLNRTLKSVKVKPYFISDVLRQYKLLLRTICDANQLIKLLMLQNDLFIVPYFSLVMVLSIVDTQNWIQLFLKYGIIFPAWVYSIRGIIVTSFLANIDVYSKKLHKEIASAVCRGHIRSVGAKVKLHRIMEDLSCDRNHLVLKEYSGSVTQMDVYENVFRIGEFTMLLIEFSRKFQATSFI